MHDVFAGLQHDVPGNNECRYAVPSLWDAPQSHPFGGMIGVVSPGFPDTSGCTPCVYPASIPVIKYVNTALVAFLVYITAVEEFHVLQKKKS